MEPSWTFLQVLKDIILLTMRMGLCPYLAKAASAARTPAAKRQGQGGGGLRIGLSAAEGSPMAMRLTICDRLLGHSECDGRLDVSLEAGQQGQVHGRNCEVGSGWAGLAPAA